MQRDIRSSVLLMALCALVLAACSDPVPAIGRGLPKTFAEAAPYFDNRIKERFPIGSDEETLRAELHGEGFTIKELHDPSSRYRLSALYEGHDLACKESWNVQWTAEGGK